MESLRETELGVIYVANELAHSYVTAVSLFFKNLLWNIMNFVGFKYNTHTYSTLVSLGSKPLLAPIVNTIICYRTMYWKPSHVHAHISCWRHQNGNIFRVIGPLCGEFTGDRWITLTKTSDAELWWVFFIDLCLNKRSSTQSRRRWFETVSHSSYEVNVMISCFWNASGLYCTSQETSHLTIYLTHCIYLFSW